MVTLKATVVQVEEKHFIAIEDGDSSITIPISENKPNAVKSAFNKLLERIREGEFVIELKDVGDDLFTQVANEYITQLNREIHEVRGEMELNNLVSESTEEKQPV
jgi:hypothetical protein